MNTQQTGRDYRVVTTLSLPVALLTRIDEKSGPRKRSQFLEKAAERELSGQTIEAACDRLIELWCISDNAFQEARKGTDFDEREALKITVGTIHEAFGAAIGFPPGSQEFKEAWADALIRRGWARNDVGVWIPAPKTEEVAH